MRLRAAGLCYDKVTGAALPLAIGIWVSGWPTDGAHRLLLEVLWYAPVCEVPPHF